MKIGLLLRGATQFPYKFELKKDFYFKPFIKIHA